MLDYLKSQVDNLSDFEIILHQIGFRIFRYGKILFVSFADFKFTFKTILHTFDSIYVKMPVSFAVTSSYGDKCGVVSLNENTLWSFAEGTFSGMGIAIIR